MALVIRGKFCSQLFNDVKLIGNLFGKCNAIRRFSDMNVDIKPKQTYKFLFGGVGLGILAGIGYSYKVKQVKLLPGTMEFNEPLPVLKSFPKNIKISRQIINPSDSTGLKLTLFQYPTCPFCCKVRAFLDFYGISYDVVEVDPVLRQQIKWSSYKKVPILLVKVNDGYEQLNDSSMIISGLSSYLRDKTTDFNLMKENYPTISYEDDGKIRSEVVNRYFLMGNIVPSPKIKQLQKEERKWREWADSYLVHLLSPNVYRTTEEAVQSFKWFSEVGEWERLFPLWERLVIIYVGAYAMWIVGKILKKRHNIKGDGRVALYEACRKWTQEIKKRKTEFFGGSQPNLADLAVYGVLSSIEGCQAFTEALEETNIGPWYYRTKNAVQNHIGNCIYNTYTP